MRLKGFDDKASASAQNLKHGQHLAQDELEHERFLALLSSGSVNASITDDKINQILSVSCCFVDKVLNVFALIQVPGSICPCTQRVFGCRALTRLLAQPLESCRYILTGS
jgi:hypothetical protein